MYAIRSYYARLTEDRKDRELSITYDENDLKIIQNKCIECQSNPCVLEAKNKKTTIETLYGYFLTKPEKLSEKHINVFSNWNGSNFLKDTEGSLKYLLENDMKTEGLNDFSKKALTKTNLIVEKTRHQLGRNNFVQHTLYEVIRNLYYSTFKNGKTAPAQIISIEQIGQSSKFIDYKITYQPEINEETLARSTRVYSEKNINKSDRLDSYYAIRNSKTHILAIEAKPLLTRSIFVITSYSIHYTKLYECYLYKSVKGGAHGQF